PGTPLPWPSLFEMPQAGISPNQESNDEDVDHLYRRRRTYRRRLVRPGTGYDGLPLNGKHHAEVADERHFSLLHYYVRERRP
ncbi:MAG: hypothetical protein WA478_10965, partial [Pseudolabrys sp.]